MANNTRDTRYPITLFGESFALSGVAETWRKMAEGRIELDETWVREVVGQLPWAAGMTIRRVERSKRSGGAHAGSPVIQVEFAEDDVSLLLSGSSVYNAVARAAVPKELQRDASRRRVSPLAVADHDIDVLIRSRDEQITELHRALGQPRRGRHGARPDDRGRRSSHRASDPAASDGRTESAL